MAEKKELENITIRKAQNNDCPGIFKMIQELAHYEKMSHKTKISAKSWFKMFKNLLQS